MNTGVRLDWLMHNLFEFIYQYEHLWPLFELGHGQFWFLECYLMDLKLENKKVLPIGFRHKTYCKGVQVPSAGPMHLICHCMRVNRYILFKIN